MMRIADFDTSDLPITFVGDTREGSFTFQHVWPETIIASVVGRLLREIVEFDGIYERIFGRATITDAKRAGDGGVEIKVQL